MITSNVPNTVCADPAGITLMYGEYANFICGYFSYLVYCTTL